MAEHPLARKEGLIVEEAGDELLVYSEGDHNAHRLNRTAAVVWRHCDGTRSVSDLAAVLAGELGELADEDLVLITLDGLAESGLLDNVQPRPAEEADVSRRRFIKRAGAVAA